MSKAKKPKLTKEERDKMLEPFIELQNKGFDEKSFEKKHFGKELIVNDEEIQKYFTEATQNENPAKELFEVRGDIRTRTDLTKKQIAGVVKLEFLSEELNFPELKTLTNNFMLLQVSKDRKSRGEYVEVHKADRDAQQGGGFFKNWGNMFKNGN